ncbi:hypothetical protein CEE39_06380 [bacterium (candidate division B38) B3_B38]|nr:MAG: hypothetical protein CEE39_06380 [bacterium (candidate division B38) B3_B38]
MNPITEGDSRRKKSLSKAVDEILKLIAEGEESSALLQEKLSLLKGDSSRLIPLIEQRIARLKGERIQKILILAETMGDPGFSPFLAAIGRLKLVGLDTRIKALHLIEQQGEKVDEELKSQLAAGKELLQRLKAALEKAGKNLSRSISPLMKQLSSLTTEVQLSLAVQLVEDKGTASFPLLCLWWGRNREVDRALIELIVGVGERDSADALQKLEEKTSNKELLKLLKRGLFKLKTRGISPTKEPKRKPYRLKLQPSVMEVAYGSQIVPSGGRLLMLARSAPPTGLRVCQAIVYDNYGIKQFHCSEMSRRTFRDVLRQVKEEDNLSMVELEPSYCQFLLEESYQLNIQTHNSAPAEYLQWKGWIGKPKKKYKLPLIYGYLPPKAIRGEDELIPRSKELWQHGEFNIWLLSLEEIKEYVEEIEEAKRSRIILADHQKEFRLTSLLSEATNSFFSSQKNRYKRRLEEVALWLFLRGNEQEAKLCVAVALAMEEREPSSIPFLFQLMERSIEFYQKQKEEKRKEDTSLIIPP